MNDFNEFLNILRSQPTANKAKSAPSAAEDVPKADRPEVPKSGVLARPIRTCGNPRTAGGRNSTSFRNAGSIATCRAGE